MKECEILSANLLTDFKTASSDQYWKAPRITFQRDNKGVNLDGKIIIILFKKVLAQKEAVEDFMIFLPKLRR